MKLIKRASQEIGSFKLKLVQKKEPLGSFFK
jgi:hypothetical protein